MKLFFLFVFFYFTQVFNFSLSSEMKPLSKILKKDNSNTKILYSLIRCSSLHYAASNKMLSSNNHNKNRLSKIGKENAELFVLSAKKFVKINNFSMSDNQITENVKNIVIEYQKRWKKNYINNGEEWSKMTLEDLEMCKFLLTSITKP